MTAISTFGFLPFVPFVFVVSSWSTELWRPYMRVRLFYVPAVNYYKHHLCCPAIEAITDTPLCNI